MKLATHNSLSSYNPKHWWMQLINPFAQCQSLGIGEQWKEGVRMYDIRVKPFSCEAAHGLVTYDIDVQEVLRWLNNKSIKQSSKERIYVRLCCENSIWQCEDEVTDWFEKYFKGCKKTYKNLVFCGGYIKTGWTKVLNVKDPEYIELYRTLNAYKAQKGLKNKLKSIFEYIKHPFPKYWAEKDNATYLDTFKDYDGFVMIDYVGTP